MRSAAISLSRMLGHFYCSQYPAASYGTSEWTVKETGNRKQETGRQVVTQFGSGKDEKLPAPKAGGLYKTHDTNEDGFVEASPSRVFRGGEGTFLPKLSHHRPPGLFRESDGEIEAVTGLRASDIFMPGNGIFSGGRDI
jgi:hypothetical protein